MDTSLCKNCKGFCCDDFAVTVSPEEVENAYHIWVNKGGDVERRGLTRTFKKVHGEHRYFDGIHLIFPMLVFTHQDNIHPDGDVTASDTIYHYKCKHHNAKTNDCDIHEIRPMVCRTFPDNKFCGYREVKDKNVIEFRPKWFEFGLSQEEWGRRYRGENKDSVVEEQCDVADDNQKDPEVSEPQKEEPSDQSILDRLDKPSEIITELKEETE